MNTRKMECGKEVLAIGQEGSLKDLENKLNTCFNCVDCIGCLKSIHLTKQFLSSQENLIYMIEQIKKEQILHCTP